MTWELMQMDEVLGCRHFQTLSDSV